MLKNINLWVQAVIYTLAGFNHFINAAFYLDLIPPYLGDASLLNALAGIAEVVLGIGLFFPQTRTLAAWGLILMLIAFIPSHVYFIQIGSCVDGSLCVPEWLSWGRLIIIHPLLMYWAWSVKKIKEVR